MKRIIVVLIIFLFVVSICFSDELPVGFWGFNFGMTIDEVLQHANNNGFSVESRDDHRTWVDPSPEGFYYWDILPPFPLLYKDNRSISRFGGYTDFFLKNDDGDKRMSVIFGDNKMFQISRGYALPDGYSPLEMVQELIEKYGNPDDEYIMIRTPPSGLIIKDYGYLWNNSNIAMEICFSSIDVWGNGDFNWEPHVSLKYIDLNITKFLSDEIMNLKNQIETEGLENFNPEL